jgi:hypothetical protein
MKDTIVNLIVLAALSFSDAALAAGEPGGKAQPAAAEPVTAASAVPTATVVESTPTASAKKPQPATRPTSGKHTRAKAVRPKDLDLRHCLELDNNPAIARCAHE